MEFFWSSTRTLLGFKGGKLIKPDSSSGLFVLSDLELDLPLHGHLLDVDETLVTEGLALLYLHQYGTHWNTRGKGVNSVGSNACIRLRTRIKLGTSDVTSLRVWYVRYNVCLCVLRCVICSLQCVFVWLQCVFVCDYVCYSVCVCVCGYSEAQFKWVGENFSSCHHTNSKKVYTYLWRFQSTVGIEINQLIPV